LQTIKGLSQDAVKRILELPSFTTLGKQQLLKVIDNLKLNVKKVADNINFNTNM